MRGVPRVKLLCGKQTFIACTLVLLRAFYENEIFYYLAVLRE